MHVLLHPSFDAKAQPERVGREHADFAPAVETLTEPEGGLVLADTLAPTRGRRVVMPPSSSGSVSVSPERVGTHYAGSAPRETVDQALLEKVHAIQSRASGVVE